MQPSPERLARLIALLALETSAWSEPARPALGSPAAGAPAPRRAPRPPPHPGGGVVDPGGAAGDLRRLGDRPHHAQRAALRQPGGVPGHRGDATSPRSAPRRSWSTPPAGRPSASSSGARRQELRLTRSDLASALDVAPGTVVAWELGYRTPGPKQLPRLAAALEVDTSSLVAALPAAPPTSPWASSSRAASASWGSTQQRSPGASAPPRRPSAAGSTAAAGPPPPTSNASPRSLPSATTTSCAPRRRSDEPGRRRRGDDRGATLIEAAIVLPLLFMLLFGIIEIGMALSSYSTAANATRAGTRMGSVAGNDADADLRILQRMASESTGFGSDDIDYIIVWNATDPASIRRSRLRAARAVRRGRRPRHLAQHLVARRRAGPARRWGRATCTCGRRLPAVRSTWRTARPPAALRRTGSGAVGRRIRGVAQGRLQVGPDEAERSRSRRARRDTRGRARTSSASTSRLATRTSRESWVLTSRSRTTGSPCSSPTPPRPGP